MKALFDLQDVWNIVSNGYKESESDATLSESLTRSFAKYKKERPKGSDHYHSIKPL